MVEATAVEHLEALGHVALAARGREPPRVRIAMAVGAFGVWHGPVERNARPVSAWCDPWLRSVMACLAAHIRVGPGEGIATRVVIESPCRCPPLCIVALIASTPQ